MKYVFELTAPEASIIYEALKSHKSDDPVRQAALLARVHLLTEYTTSAENTNRLRARYRLMTHSDPDEV